MRLLVSRVVAQVPGLHTRRNSSSCIIYLTSLATNYVQQIFSATLALMTNLMS